MAAPLCVLLGPTASGKTAVSLPLAERLGAEIVSVDSRQLYRGMEIGSAAPSPGERARVPHHLVAIEDPERSWSAGEYGRRARGVIAEIEKRGKIPLLVGGSGLYLRAVLGGLDEGLPRDESLRKRLRERAQREGASALHRELAGLDPASAARISPRDAQRITRALEIVLAGGRPAADMMTRGRGSEAGARIAVLDRTREDLEARIRARVEAMIHEGLEEEVRALLGGGIDPENPILKSVGYAETVRLLRGGLDREAWTELIAVNTRRYAKRQRTWFRSLTGAVWFAVSPEEPPEATSGRVAAAWSENDGTSTG